MTSIQSTTIKVTKTTLEEIKIYCRKAGKPVGEWVQTAWDFIKSNDFDIYDTESTPFLMVPEHQKEELSKVDVLCEVIGKMIDNQQKLLLPPNDELVRLNSEKASAYTKVEMLEREVSELRSKISELEKYKEKAHLELCRVQSEQKVIGKIKVNIDL